MRNFKKLFSALIAFLVLTMLNPVEANAAYWKQDSNNHWNYVQDNGYNATGWKKISGKWYYFNENEVMQTGWINSNGNWYYCWGDGSMASNTTVDGCYLNESGAWTTALPTVTTTSNNKAANNSIGTVNKKSQTVYITATGKKYHAIPKCGNTKSSRAATLEEAQRLGLGACQKCY